jgi:maleate isomerase
VTTFSELVPTMRSVKKVGHITPSCNSVLEHVTGMVTNSVSHLVSSHFARIPVDSITLADHDRNQFTVETMVAAATSLNDACMDAILWNGTSACWNGTQSDHDICTAITAETGVDASTTILAQYEVFERYRFRTFGLALPYTDDVTVKTMETFRAVGYEAVSHANLRMTSGRDMANVPFSAIRQLISDADSPQAECVIVVCTGLPSAFLVQQMESELGKPVFDSVLVTVQKGLSLVGVDDPLHGWGCLMRNELSVKA